MNIKMWTGNKGKKYKLHKKYGGIIMAVSKAYISCLDAEATKLFNKDMATATLNLNIIKEGKELLKRLTGSKKEK